MMTEPPLPMRGVDTLDTLRAENVTLNIRNSAQEQELLQVKHALRVAESRVNAGGLKQRVVIKQPLPGGPSPGSSSSSRAQQQQRERRSPSGGSVVAVAAAAAESSSAAAAATAEWQRYVEHAAAGGAEEAAASGGGDVGHCDLDTVVSALHQQLRARTDELKCALDDVQELRAALDASRAEHGAALAKVRDMEVQLDHRGISTASASQAYLMEQIKFLHLEVERLEGELRAVREQAAEELRAAQMNATKMLQEKDDALRAAVEGRQRAMRAASTGSGGGSSRGGGGGGEDLFTRCSMLETQLATALSEKTAANADKYDALAKIRKLEAALKEKRAQAMSVSKSADEETHSLRRQQQALQDTVAALYSERTELQQQLEQLRERHNAPRRSTEAQCDDTRPAVAAAATQCDAPPPTFAAGCQVNTIQHFADAFGDSVQSVAHTLEQKCMELDTARGDLERLAAVHSETLDFLDLTKRRLSTELAQRQTLQEDNEKLALQVRALQQQSSQLQAAIRERETRVQEAEERMRQASNSELQHAEERRRWEEQGKASAVDLQHLVANQNLANQQIGRLTSENDQLREQIQVLMQRESQGQYSLRAKDVELQELLQAYQQATQEVQGHLNAQKSLEQECENLRAHVGHKEERIVHLSEQVAQLHQREQQLSIDLQSFDYETGQLHRKLVNSESAIASHRGQISDLQQTVAAGERVQQELERHSAELLKQLVVKDNECHLLRSRCDQLEQEHGALSSAHRAESARLRELEDQNARLVVKSIMGTAAAASKGEGSTPAMGAAAAEQLHRTQRELEEVKTSLAKTTEALRQANTAIQREQKATAELDARVQQQREAIAALEKQKQELQELLLQQSKALDDMSR